MNGKQDGDPGAKGNHGDDFPPLPDWAEEFEADQEKLYVYARGQLVVADRPDVQQLVQEELKAAGLSFRRVRVAKELPIIRYVFEGGSVPELVERIRARGGPHLPVGPNHVLAGEGHIKYINLLGPRPALPLDAVRGGKGAKGFGATVAVVDTGVYTKHPWFQGLDVSTDRPDFFTNTRAPLPVEAGHGTFIAGVILQQAPGTRVVGRQAMSHDGFVDEASVAARLMDLADADIINLSLGGYSHGDEGFAAIGAAINVMARRNPETVVVAAAGNLASSRPFFPAAIKPVIAVGALDAAGQRACFSNFGYWVDTSRLGLDVHSTFGFWKGKRVERLNDSPPGCDGQLGAFAADPQAPFDGFALWSGTSFAAPQVSAAIAIGVGEGMTARDAAVQVLSGP